MNFKESFAVNKYFEMKVPFEDETESRAFGELLRALCDGYYAGTNLFGCAISAEEIPEIDEAFEVPEKYCIFYKIKILVNEEKEARQLSRIIGMLADCVLGADDIFYNFKFCIDDGI